LDSPDGETKVKRSGGKRRGSDYHLLIAATSVIVVIAVIGAMVLLVPAAPAETEARFAFRDGDHLNYTISGTYHSRAVTGTYNVSLDDVVNGQATTMYPSVNVSDQTIWTNISDLSLSANYLQGQDVGSGHFSTPFGVKEVKWNFRIHPEGLFEIDFYGLDPFVVYGGVVNGKDTHLDFVLKATSNPFVKENNTKPIGMTKDVFPLTTSGTSRSMVFQNVTMYAPFYHPDGGALTFSMGLHAFDMDVYGFSEGNIRSMAEGGPFAYDLKATELAVGNVSRTLTMPPRTYILAFLFHSPAQDLTTESTYEWSVAWNE
jgi:hypothetical protein